MLFAYRSLRAPDGRTVTIGVGLPRQAEPEIWECAWKCQIDGESAMGDVAIGADSLQALYCALGDLHETCKAHSWTWLSEHPDYTGVAMILSLTPYHDEKAMADVIRQELVCQLPRL